MSSRIILVCLLLLQSGAVVIASELPTTLKSIHNIYFDPSIFYKTEKVYTEFILSNETDFSNEIAATYSTGSPVDINPDEIVFLVSSDGRFSAASETRLSIKVKYLF